MAKNTANYGNDSIRQLKDEERVRLRPAVIFGSDGLDGCAHAAFEILSNAVDEARQGFNAVFASGGVPDDAPCHTCAQGDDSTPPAFLEAAGLVKSRGEAKRLIKEGALSVDGQRCDEAMSPLACAL